MKWLDRSLILGPYLTLCLSQTELDEVCCHLKMKEPLTIPQVNACVFTIKNTKDGRSACIVCLPILLGKHLVEIMGLLVHESMHIWQEVRRFIGEDNPSKEFEAYALQNISQTLVEEFLSRVVCRGLVVRSLK